MQTKKPRLIITKTLTPPLPATSIPSWGGRIPGGTPSASPTGLSSVATAVGGRNPQRTPPACTRFNNKTWQEYQDWMTKYQEAYEQIYQRPLKCIYGSPREISHKKIPIDAKILVIEMNNDENRIMGIGEIQNKTASEAYRSTPPSRVVSFASPSGVVSFANAHSTHPSGPDSTSTHNTSVATAPPTGLSSVATAVGGRNPQIKFNIFSDRNYTRYLYIGNSHYATREELERNHTADARYINEQLMHIKMPQTPQQSHQQLTIIQSLERLLFKGARHMKRGSGITMIRVLSCSVAPFVSTKLTSATSR
jgi:hypothetical protein